MKKLLVRKNLMKKIPEMKRVEYEKLDACMQKI